MRLPPASAPESQKQRLFSFYLVNWVVGVKLFFIFLLAVILVISTEQVKAWAVAMILSIATYFWRLYPTIKKLDAMGCITLNGPSMAPSWMSAGFLIMFALVLIGHILLGVIGGGARGLPAFAGSDPADRRHLYSGPYALPHGDF